MKPRTKQIALLSLVLVCVALVFGNFGRRWTRMPQRGWSGMRFNYNLSSGQATFSVESMNPLGPAARAGMEVNDRVVAINGAREKLNEANRGFKPGETVVYTVSRDGKERQIAVRLENPFRRMPVLIDLFLDFFVGMAFLTVGTLVYWKRPADHRALIFFFSCSMFGFGRLMSMGPRHAEPTAARRARHGGVSGRYVPVLPCPFALLPDLSEAASHSGPAPRGAALDLRFAGGHGAAVGRPHEHRDDGAPADRDEVRVAAGFDCG